MGSYDEGAQDKADGITLMNICCLKISLMPLPSLTCSGPPLPSAPAPPPRDLSFLTPLRGLLSLAVAVHHLTLTYLPNIQVRVWSCIRV